MGGCCGNRRSLTVVTTCCAVASFAFLCIAVATDYWLHAFELVFDVNNTAKYMETTSGLWRKCVVDSEYNYNILLLRYRW